MQDIKKILIFIAINAFGFFSVGICFALGTLTGLINGSELTLNTIEFQKWFFTGTILTWLVCAVFSLSYFFIRSKLRFLFLWAPVFIPFGYGLSILVLL